MAINRYDFHAKLVEISANTYFQPGSSIKLKYPCILYEKSNEFSLYADNKLYKSDNEYRITIIDKDADSKLPDKLKAAFPASQFENFLVVDNLYHTIYKLYLF